jgi:hypothetical protein
VALGGKIMIVEFCSIFCGGLLFSNTYPFIKLPAFYLYFLLRLLCFHCFKFLFFYQWFVVLSNFNILYFKYGFFSFSDLNLLYFIRFSIYHFFICIFSFNLIPYFIVFVVQCFSFSFVFLYDYYPLLLNVLIRLILLLMLC